MVLDWFNTKEVVALANEVAGELQKLPLGDWGSIKQGPTRMEFQKSDAVIARVTEFAGRRDLGIYKKAKFLNTVKWQLKDAGLNEDLVDEFVALLTAALNVRPEKGA